MRDINGPNTYFFFILFEHQKRTKNRPMWPLKVQSKIENTPF